MDSHGRVFYIDHATRTTSWQRPGGSSIVSSGGGAEQQRRQLDRRYQSIRRTISSHQLEAVDQPGAPPGCRLLTRPDFFTILHMNQVSNADNGIILYFIHVNIYDVSTSFKTHHWAIILFM